MGTLHAASTPEVHVAGAPVTCGCEGPDGPLGLPVHGKALYWCANLTLLQLGLSRDNHNTTQTQTHPEHPGLWVRNTCSSLLFPSSSSLDSSFLFSPSRPCHR